MKGVRSVSRFVPAQFSLSCFLPRVPSAPSIAGSPGTVEQGAKRGPSVFPFCSENALGGVNQLSL